MKSIEVHTTPLEPIEAVRNPLSPHWYPLEKYCNALEVHWNALEHIGTHWKCIGSHGTRSVCEASWKRIGTQGIGTHRKCVGDALEALRKCIGTQWKRSAWEAQWNAAQVDWNALRVHWNEAGKWKGVCRTAQAFQKAGPQ